MLKSYNEERERSKQPGYVCRYDDYDGGDYEESFTQVVGELNATREGYRTHAPHSQPRGTHAAASQEAKANSPAAKDDFGSGIL